jgi:hypothetical protein
MGLADFGIQARNLVLFSYNACEELMKLPAILLVLLLLVVVAISEQRIPLSMLLIIPLWGVKWLWNRKYGSTNA